MIHVPVTDVTWGGLGAPAPVELKSDCFFSLHLDFPCQYKE